MTSGNVIRSDRESLPVDVGCAASVSSTEIDCIKFINSIAKQNAEIQMNIADIVISILLFPHTSIVVIFLITRKPVISNTMTTAMPIYPAGVLKNAETIAGLT